MKKTVSADVIGKRLRTLRDIRPKTKTAQQLGISYSSLCKYEAGLRVPKSDLKQRIADYFGTSVEAIFYAPENHDK